MTEITCPFCEKQFEDTPINGSVQCPRCKEYFDTEPASVEPDDSMDGDATSALASAGLGTDEDYEHNLIDDQDQFGDTEQ